MRRSLLFAAPLVLAVGCRSVHPNDLVILEVPGAPRYALSTEDGILAINEDDLAVNEVPIVYWYRGAQLLDDAVVEARSGEFGILKPLTAKIGFATFAAVEPLPGEELWVQVLAEDYERRPTMIEVSLFEEGTYGDLLAVDEWLWSPDRLAGEWTGAGVYVRRKGAYELVGVVNGMVASNPDPSWWDRWFGSTDLVTFAGLDAIAPTLPLSSDYFTRRIRAFRPDFEYGVERDGTEWKSENR